MITGQLSVRCKHTHVTQSAARTACQETNATAYHKDRAKIREKKTSAFELNRLYLYMYVQLILSIITLYMSLHEFILKLLFIALHTVTLMTYVEQ